MSDKQSTPFTLNDNTFHPLSIPPPPLPPRFLPPYTSPPAFRPSTTYIPPHLSGTNISPFSTHAFQGDNNVLPAPVWTDACSPLPSKTDDGSQQRVEYWLRSKEIKEVNKKNNSNIKIYQAKEKLNTAFSLIKELENGALTLNVMVKSVTPSEWDQKCNEIELKKRELLSVLNELKLSKEEIKAKCLKRSKKRARLRRQAHKRKLKNENDKVHRQNLHFRIDNWQKEMQEVVERTKREQELQQEADAVLWGVRQRKGEARRQLELLSTLQQLREVRVRRRSAAGQSVSAIEIQTFTTITDRLKALWSRYMTECQLEEQALRVVLAENEEPHNSVATFKKLVLNEWQVALFGSSSSHDETNSNLVDTRLNWDRFIVDGDTILASTIPTGWVLPVPPSSDQWKSLLKY